MIAYSYRKLLKKRRSPGERERTIVPGTHLNSEGVKLNSKKVEAVKDFPVPKNMKEVKSFLGLPNFYRRHIPDMAIISRTLTALTRKNMEFM